MVNSILFLCINAENSFYQFFYENKRKKEKERIIITSWKGCKSSSFNDSLGRLTVSFENKVFFQIIIHIYVFF